MGNFRTFLKWFLIFIPFSVMIGYEINSSLLVSWVWDFVPMQFNTAICLLILGIYVSHRNELRWALAIPFVLALITLMQDVFGFDLNIDEVVVFFESVDVPNIGRMSPLTALSVMTACTFAWFKRKGGIALLLILAAPPMLGHLIHFFTGVKYDWLHTIPLTETTFMAVNTSTWFLTLIAEVVTRENGKDVTKKINQ